MATAVHLAEWKVANSVKMTGFEKLLKLLRGFILPQQANCSLPETWYSVEQCLNVPDVKQYIKHSCPCDKHRYCMDEFRNGVWDWGEKCPLCKLSRWSPESLRRRSGTPVPRKIYYDFGLRQVRRTPDAPYMHVYCVLQHSL